MKTAQQLVAEVQGSINQVTTTELKNKLASDDIVVIDVREPGEYSGGHIADAVNFPRGVLEMKIHMHPKVNNESSPEVAMETLAKEDIYLICRSGARSALATESLKRLGFEKVTSVAGGMAEWEKLGFETVK